MSQAATIEFPRRDVAALMAQMQRARKELGVSLGGSVKMAARAVMTSLAASTKVAEPFRDYWDTGEVSRTGENRKWVVVTKYETSRRRGKDLRRSWQGNWREQIIYAKDESELRRRRAVIVQMRGLAKESWKQMGRKAGVPISAASVPSRNRRIMLKAARRWVSVRQNLNGPDPYIHVTDELVYIGDALAGGPKQADTAVERAARAMEKSIGDRIARKFGAK